MKKFVLILAIVSLSGCTSLRYDPKEIRFKGTGWESITTSLGVGEVKYSPPTGISQRSISITSGLLTLFTDTARDVDINVSDLVRTELDRAVKERTINKIEPVTACTLNSEVFYLKMNKAGSVITTFRYSLVKGGKELYRSKIESKSPSPIFTSDTSSEIQLIASGIHRNFNDLAAQDQFKSILKTECQQPANG